jgi:membrane fusion protein, heavy metal efflux system
MTIRLGIFLLSVVALVGCGGKKEQTAEVKPEAAAPGDNSRHAHEDEGGDPHGHTEHAGEKDRLHLDPGMLRDLRLTVAPVESRPGGEGVSALGELRVNEDAYAEVGPPVAARVVRVFVAPGAVVKAGDPLVDLQSQELGHARSEHATARARLATARRALERKQGLAAERIVPLREVQEAESDVASLQAAVEAAQGAILAMGLSEADIGGSGSRFTLRSPIAGTVIERNAVVGRVTEPTRPLFRVGDLSTLWLEVHGFERDAVRVKVGATARVALPALPGEAFDGKIALVGRQVDPGSRTIPIRIELKNATGALRPGMSANAWLPIGDEGSRITAVPATALQRLDNQWVVFLPTDEESEFIKRPVGRGRELGADVEILSGVQPGESVIVDGAFLLKAEAEKAKGAGDHHDH